MAAADASTPSVESCGCDCSAVPAMLNPAALEKLVFDVGDATPTPTPAPAWVVYFTDGVAEESYVWLMHSSHSITTDAPQVRRAVDVCGVRLSVSCCLK